MNELISLFYSIVPAAQFGNRQGTGSCWGGDWGFPFGGLGLLILLVIAVLVLMPIMRGRFYGVSQHPQEDALDILKRRYARGEISKEEYEEMKSNLS